MTMWDTIQPGLDDGGAGPWSPGTAVPAAMAGEALARGLAQVLDQLDYGLLLVDGDGLLLHANAAAHGALDDRHPLQLLGGTLRTRLGRDVAPLFEAIQAAASRGLQRLLALGDAERQADVAVLPLHLREGRGLALLLLGRAQLCAPLSVLGFARSRGLTVAEVRVLEALCAGQAPADIARAHGVGIATVRTQIGAIRAKTGAGRIADVVDMLGRLPPMVGSLPPQRGAATIAAWPARARTLNS
jgi:DNA-binding CsgD family transcriptional regulator